MFNSDLAVELIPIKKQLFLDTSYKKPIRINLSLKHSLEDAYYLTLTGRTLVVNNIGGKLREDNISSNSDLSYILQDIFNLSCERVKGIYTSNITVFADEFLQRLKNPYQIDVISLVAKPVSKIKDMQELNTVYENAFETLLYIVNKHREITSLVFVPVGCEEFGHDPSLVADLFYRYIQRYSWGNISNIIISCDGNRDNYNAFKRNN
jgi:hypothetical protein